MISLGTIHARAHEHAHAHAHPPTHTHTHSQAPLEKRSRGTRRPQCETSVNKCAPKVRGHCTSIFSPASYSLQETFEAVAGWYGLALWAAQFVYPYSTIQQSRL